jgi:ornithine cyclodeaminase/alanine dehydrogenase-like protein (mu-crystallin family)
MEAGDLILAHDEGALDWARVVELGAIVAGKTPGRVSDADVTLFESQGLAIEDLAAAAHVYETLTA